MSNLIDRSVLLQEVESLIVTVTGLRAGKGVLREYAKQYRDTLLRVINEQPTIEAAPVMRGEWKEYEEVGSRGYHYCSKCKYPAFKREFCGRSIEKLSNFCPYCGANMKGGAE